MNIKRLAAIIFILGCTTAGWFVLGGAIALRTGARASAQSALVGESWGPPLVQAHPEVFYLSPTSAKPHVDLQPDRSDVHVSLQYQPKRKGLLWYRTYGTKLVATYLIRNPSPIRQTIYFRFKLPAENTSFVDFKFQIGDTAPSPREPENGVITDSILLEAGQSAPVTISYEARGSDQWTYSFGGKSRIHEFALTMDTDFKEIDFPAGTTSAPTRNQHAKGWVLEWIYPDVIAAAPIGMSMPKVLNAGPVASRVSFFAPVSLLFYFAVLLLVCMVRGVDLHPMNYFFLAAGFFAFQLLFAYLVDLLPLLPSFLIAAAVSLALVGGYLHMATRGRLTLLALAAQFAYMVLFSYSFFFDGLTGLTITVGAIVTLALLMAFTARIDWASKFAGPVKSAATPSPIPHMPGA